MSTRIDRMQSFLMTTVGTTAPLIVFEWVMGNHIFSLVFGVILLILAVLFWFFLSDRPETPQRG